MGAAPQIKTDELYELLRIGEIAEFNKRVQAGETCDLTHADFRGVDLRGVAAEGLDFTGSYFRRADLRGIDFSKSDLDGASLHRARVAGCLFPRDIDIREIQASVDLGTRMRARR